MELNSKNQNIFKKYYKFNLKPMKINCSNDVKWFIEKKKQFNNFDHIHIKSKKNYKILMNLVTEFVQNQIISSIIISFINKIYLIFKIK